MNTSELLDLFQLGVGGQVEKPQPPSGNDQGESGKPAKQEGLKSILENLPELWDEDQYKTEYDLSSFMQSLA